MTKKNADSSGVKIGQYTKYQREKKNLSLNELARNADLTPSFLMRLERGDYQDVSFQAIEKIAKALNTDVQLFLKKCGLSKTSGTLPGLDYYFKEKYQLPDEAIEDLRLFIKFLQSKYKKEISKMKKAHQKYWKS